MSLTPILNAISILRQAVFEAFDPLTTYPVYWQQADEQVQPPFVIYQSQDAGGRAAKHIGDYGWEGLITVRALAPTQGAAEELLAAVAPGMDALQATGYSFTADYQGPLVVAPDPFGVWQAGHIWRVALGT